MFAVLALVALRRGERERARERAERALAICRQHGMGQIGLMGARRPGADRDRSRRAPTLARRRRAAACARFVSHNQVQLPELAIDALLEIGDWGGVEKYCQRIRSYTAAEPLTLWDFVVARATALVAVGRGERSDALRATLLGLREEGVRAELNSFLPGIEVALGRLAPEAAGATSR